MSRLSRGQAALIARQQAGAALDGVVIYVRGAERIDVSGQAWAGRTVYSRLSPTAGASVVFGDRDLLIPVTALPWEPQKGDRVEETTNGETLIWEVMCPVNEPAWRYSDSGRTLFRLHFKKVG